MKRILWLLTPSALLAVGLGCNETNFVEQKDPVDPLDDQADPCIEVNPSSVVFESNRVGEDAPETRVVSVSNACEGDLEIYGLELADAGAPFQLGTIGAVLLPEGGTTDFTVTFSPITAELSSTDVLIDSNDPETPTATVNLEGEGVAPVIDVDPDEYDFGTPYIGCDLEQPYTVSNVGNALLIVDDFQFATPSAVDMSFNHELVLPVEIEPANSVEVYVDYKPLDEFQDDGYLTIESNDPFTPSVLVTATGRAAEYNDNTDFYEQPIKAATDILFTLDRSCSMSEDLNNVKNNFDTFINVLTGIDADYHVAASVDDSGCIRGSDVYIDNTFSASDAIDVFDTMANIYGSYGSLTEKGLALAEATLAPGNVGSGGCNEGFYREDAFLSMVGVSDEPDQSASPYTYYVSLFQGLKDNPDEFVYNAVAGDYPSGCGSADAGTGYYESTVATGGLFLSICATDWASHLEVLAVGSVAQKSAFGLTQTPVPETIEVDIDGIDTAVGWEYDETANAVQFETEHIPAGGSTIEIHYQLAPPCDT